MQRWMDRRPWAEATSGPAPPPCRRRGKPDMARRATRGRTDRRKAARGRPSGTSRRLRRAGPAGNIPRSHPVGRTSVWFRQRSWSGPQRLPEAGWIPVHLVPCAPCSWQAPELCCCGSRSAQAGSREARQEAGVEAGQEAGLEAGPGTGRAHPDSPEGAGRRHAVCLLLQRWLCCFRPWQARTQPLLPLSAPTQTWPARWRRTHRLRRNSSSPGRRVGSHRRDGPGCPTGGRFLPC